MDKPSLPPLPLNLHSGRITGLAPGLLPAAGGGPRPSGAPQGEIKEEGEGRRKRAGGGGGGGEGRKRDGKVGPVASVDHVRRITHFYGMTRVVGSDGARTKVIADNRMARERWRLVAESSPRRVGEISPRDATRRDDEETEKLSRGKEACAVARLTRPGGPA